MFRARNKHRITPDIGSKTIILVFEWSRLMGYKLLSLIRTLWNSRPWPPMSGCGGETEDQVGVGDTGVFEVVSGVSAHPQTAINSLLATWRWHFLPITRCRVRDGTGLAGFNHGRLQSQWERTGGAPNRHAERIGESVLVGGYWWWALCHFAMGTCHAACEVRPEHNALAWAGATIFHGYLWTASRT